MIRLLLSLGAVLVLGGLAHSSGVVYFYFTQGVPEANRVLLDVWVAEAQLLAGGLYLAAARAARVGRAWRALGTFGALTTIGYAVAFLPVLFARAPMLLRVPTIIHLVLSVVVLMRTAKIRDRAG